MLNNTSIRLKVRLVNHTTNGLNFPDAEQAKYPHFYYAKSGNGYVYIVSPHNYDDIYGENDEFEIEVTPIAGQYYRDDTPIQLSLERLLSSHLKSDSSFGGAKGWGDRPLIPPDCDPKAMDRYDEPRTPQATSYKWVNGEGLVPRTAEDIANDLKPY